MPKKNTGKKKTTKAGKKGGSKSVSTPILTCTVKVVPASGSDATEHKHEFSDGQTVGDALAALAVSKERKNLFLNGKPATADAKLTAGCTLSVELRGQGS